MDVWQTEFLDKIEIRQNWFVLITDGKSDLTVLPIEVQLDFPSKFRRGIGGKGGYTQEVPKIEFTNLRIELKDC